MAQAADRRLDRDARRRRHHLGDGDRPDTGDEPRLSKKVEAGPKTYAAGAWLVASLPIFMVEGFYLLLTHADVLLLRQYRSPEEVAVYYAAAKTLALVAFVSFSVSAATAHKFSEYHVAGNKAELSGFLADSIRWTFWPSLAATVLILALGRPLLWLFGPQFVDGYYLMFILGVGPLARATVGPVERLLNMVGEQRACAVVYAAAFAANIALCVMLIPLFGVAGAAIAISGAMVLEAALLFGVAKQRLGLHVLHLAASAIQDDAGGQRRRSLARERADEAPRRAIGSRRMEAAVALGAMRGEWRALAARALEPNVFYDPAFALAAAPCSARMPAPCWCGRRRAAADRPVPGALERRYGVMATLTGWTHPYAPFGVPLIDRDEAEAAIGAFLDHVEADKRACRSW